MKCYDKNLAKNYHQTQKLKVHNVTGDKANDVLDTCLVIIEA